MLKTEETWWVFFFLVWITSWGPLVDKIPPGLQQGLCFRQMLLRLSLNAAGNEQLYRNAPLFISWVSGWNFLCVHHSAKVWHVWNFSVQSPCGILSGSYSKWLWQWVEDLLFLCLLFWILTCSNIESCEILPLQIRKSNLSLEISAHSCNCWYWVYE